MSHSADAERVSYQFDMDRREWRAWADTVPRSYDALHDRIAELLELDRKHDLEAAVDGDGSGGEATAEQLEELLDGAEPEEGDTRLALIRIRRRCMTATPKARAVAGGDAPPGDAADVADELTEIQRIANDLLDA